MVQVEYLNVEDVEDIDGARDKILNLLERTSNGTTIYFDGWDGLGTAAVLRSIAHALQSMQDPHPKLCFGRIIYMDCSICESKRAMQRRIAEELKLDHKTMEMFDKQDEEDDFHGVDPTSRNAIRDVAEVIHRTLRESSFILIFLNGSDEEVVLSRLGVSELNECVIIWTFKKGFPMKGLGLSGFITSVQELRSRLRNTDIFLACREWIIMSSDDVSALVREEAASILTHHPYMRDDDRAAVIDCYLYVLFLLRSFQEGTSRLWAAHGTNYWICDGIIQGARTRDICKALCQEVSFDSLLHLNPSYPDEFYSRLLQHANLPPHWVSITSKSMIVLENMKNKLARASSVFLTFETTNGPQGLPDDLMEQCNNLRVLILSNCAFNFLSPPFGHCSTLRFLGLEHCINNNTTELVVREDEDYTANWAYLRSLWVLDVRHTDWVEILSKGNMDLMGNIMELDIEGSMCWQDAAAKLEGRLPYLERLRIVKPHRHDEEASMDIIESSFIGKTKLQVLDLSGNKDMEKLPTSLSEASSLEVLVLDGCDGLRNVVVSNSKLRSFSFDGYGPASNWTSMHELPLESSRQTYNKKKDVETSLTTLKISSTQLKNLFLRGLPNLVELDLSGCGIKILDFETMVVDVPRLKRLFLIGCEYLCAIRWYTSTTDTEGPRMPVDLELLCIDTRPGDGVPGRTRPFITQPNNFGLQVHAVTADARLARSLWDPIAHHVEKKGKADVFFDIRITSSSISCDEKTSEDHQQYPVMTASPYDDVSTSVTRVQAFPQPPGPRLDRHIEIGDGSHSVESEVAFLSYSYNLADLMGNYVQSLHVRDISTSTATPEMKFDSLKWCRVERCPRLDTVFPPGANYPNRLETIWASDLRMAHCIWSKNPLGLRFKALKHLHLRSCPNLQFALPLGGNSLPMLETIHIIHCGSLTHVFALENLENEDDIPTSVHFPELTTIHLHEVPALRQICEVKTMLALKLETIRTRGCWNLCRLPALVEDGRRRRPAVEMEKDMWDKLEWDGVKAGHHPSLYEAPLDSRYYRRRHLRTSVLR